MAFPLNVIVAFSGSHGGGPRPQRHPARHAPGRLGGNGHGSGTSASPGAQGRGHRRRDPGLRMPEAEQGLNLARNAVFVAKWPNSVPAETINRFCSSGLQAIAHCGAQCADRAHARGGRRRRRVDVDGADERQTR